MCGVKVKGRFPNKELRERLGTDDITLVLQQNRLRWYGHELRKEYAPAVKRELWTFGEGMYGVWSRQRGRPKRTWTEVVEKYSQAYKLNNEDAVDHSTWRKLTKDVWWSGRVWVGECFFWYQPTRVVLDKGLLNGSVCVIQHSRNNRRTALLRLLEEDRADKDALFSSLLNISRTISGPV